MRIGGGIQKSYKNPDEWIALVKDLTYSAVLCPVDYKASSEEKRAYLAYIEKYNLLLGEVGAWGNPLSIDPIESKEAMDYCKNQLALAEEMGANCCVNIVGARGDKWDGIYLDNYSEEVYALAVDSIREIIDSVNPQRTFYTIEPMPWMVPDSPDAYLKLLKDVDREGFAVHMDFVNMINNPKRFVDSTKFIQESFEKLGPYIKSIHIKDVKMNDTLPCSLEEVAPGKGSIDFINVLKLCEKLGKDTTVFVEHLDTHKEYKEAINFVRMTAEKEKIMIL